MHCSCPASAETAARRRRPGITVRAAAAAANNRNGCCHMLVKLVTHTHSTYLVVLPNSCVCTAAARYQQNGGRKEDGRFHSQTSSRHAGNSEAFLADPLACLAAAAAAESESDERARSPAQPMEVSTWLLCSVPCLYPV